MRPVLLISLVLLAALVAACSRTPDETRIRAAIGAMEAAVEARQPRDFMGYVGEDFAGQDGGLDRPALHNLLRAQFLRNQAVSVLIGPIDVTLHGERASARMSVTVSGGAGLLPERGAIYQVDTGWRRSGGDWMVVSATWREQ